ncbi:hypothetical protein [Pectinatus frisingensis]|uniref:hypothetical protein n=1 Tax=Pectinatus frisingensis TaxID=865 RepID=UPI0018C7E0B3|nr:hypothetical protein [Pectinatus frisingensis]
MKRICVIVFLLCTICSTVFAAKAEDYLHKLPEKVGVVIVSSVDMKTPDYFDAITDTLTPTSDEEKKYTIETGVNAQTKYQNYWDGKGFLDEQPLTKDVVFDFAKYSGYDKVLYIVIEKPVLEKNQQGGGFLFSWGTTTVTRADIEVKAYLTDGKTIIKSVDVSKEDNSAVSELRAKRSAFKKDMIEVATNIKPYL